jgi:hypothetical protein
MIGEDANHTAKRLPCIEYQLRRSGIFIENAIIDTRNSEGVK